MIQSVRQKIHTRLSWLVSPAKYFVLFFIKDPKSKMSFPEVIPQLWYCTNEGIPTRLRNSREMDLESSIETWTELTTNGWEVVKHQINKEDA